MLKKTYGLVVLLFLCLLTACHRDIPEPETKDSSFSSTKAVEASRMIIAKENPLFVKYHVKGNDVYIECIAKDVSFRNHEARMILSIDGKKTAEYHNAAFIIKGLPTGTHHLKLELFKQDEKAAAATKEMDIFIK